ncbi:hypothetical protein FHR32_008159 [Streptosporangium album]|uniref:Right handed beta helix domain-containing protein n=1 Tax=Streptosporangium album TaxID=47479 RepID=A0A7W7S4J2_9ACTN|nr:right-handed parallel beta-helix repeat-containing protein [Streptosporangium album]MBB4943758.1 hypothetical protein [Streptosporangium album]
MTRLYVAPTGNDLWPGTSEQPFATLERARDHARTLPSDVVVSLRAGTYTLTSTFDLTEDDSGVTYQAHGHGTPEREEVVISGGRAISGWRREGELWRAEVGDLDTRRLSVDGRRAERATLDGIPGTVTRTESGYVTDSTVPQSWRSPADIEFVYRGLYPWTEARLSVADISGDERSTTITMAQPAFGWADDLYNSAWEGAESHGPGAPSSVENSATFLSRPGTFALDRSTPGEHVLYYLPRPGEDPERARVVAPALQTLVHARRTRGVSFRGVTFADATWLRPGRPEGFLHYHGNGYYEGGSIEKVTFADGQAWVTVPQESAAIPANVVFENCEHVTVEGCRFTRLGATALRFSGGSRENTVLGSVFDDISGGGVSIGAATAPEGNHGNRVENNWIHHVGQEYSGSPGISLTATQNSAVAHNQVNDVPHCGIVINGGEDAYGGRILHNLTFNTMGVLADGGGIYLSSSQGTSGADRTVVRGNVIRDTLTPYNFGLYTDYGTAWATVEGNVVCRGDNTAVLQVWPPLENVVYTGNFWDADPIGLDALPEGVVYEKNSTLPKDGFDQALGETAGAGILAEAGLEPAYRHLLAG